MTKCVLLQPFAQKYDWGKVGCDSKVAELITAGYGVEIDDTTPYAELWMGDHSNGPCFVLDGDKSIPIATWLKSHSLGSIDFLFKVLSVRKALSIQTHPDAALARRLHQTYPDVYKDPNPKPELALALTAFKALFGFRPVDQIVEFLDSIPALAEVVGPVPAQALRDSVPQSPDCQKDALRGAYTALMHADTDIVASAINSITSPTRAPLCEEAVLLAIELNRQFPGGDIGVLSVFFLNIVSLSPGQCLFMGPNVPHAYLSGDIIECMTCSDNVIRGGLTPKFKDVETLVTSLDYTCMHPSLLSPVNIDGTVHPCWKPHGVPFAVSRYSLTAGQHCTINTGAHGPSIALVIRGSGTIDRITFKEGQSLLLSPSSVFELTAPAENVDVYVAFNPL